MTTELTHARLLELLDVDVSTGVLTWRLKRRGVRSGKVAGTTETDGYVIVCVDGKRYPAHHLVWFFAHGDWPVAQLDHKDTVRSHNGIDNLRQATNAQNQQNLRRPRCGNKSGFLGVSLHKATGKYAAEIQVGDKRRHIGLFNRPDAASVAYLAAKVQMHPYQTLVENGLT